MRGLRVTRAIWGCPHKAMRRGSQPTSWVIRERSIWKCDDLMAKDGAGKRRKRRRRERDEEARSRNAQFRGHSTSPPYTVVQLSSREKQERSSLKSEKRNYTARRFDIEVPCEETRKVFSKGSPHGLKLGIRELGFQLAFEEACQRLQIHTLRARPS